MDGQMNEKDYNHFSGEYGIFCGLALASLLVKAHFVIFSPSLPAFFWFYLHVCWVMKCYRRNISKLIKIPNNYF